MTRVRSRVSRFAADTSGAVTVDWVVMTAALAGIGIAVMASIGSGMSSLADRISDQMKVEAQGENGQSLDSE